MKVAELQHLIDDGENELVDFKRDFDISTPKGKSNFVKDVISLVNAHGESSRYLLIGVEDDKSLRGITGVDLDDADLHEIIDAYVEPRIGFGFRTISYRSVTIGVIEIFISTERFHVVKKDLQAPDSKGKQIKYLERGQIWIRRGAKNSPLTAQDFQKLRQRFLDDYLDQPFISVCFGNAEEKVELAADWVGREGGYPNIGTPERPNRMPNPRWYEMPHPPGTAPLVFQIENHSTIKAENVKIAIRPPNGCTVVGKESITIASAIIGGKPIEMNMHILTASFETLPHRPVALTEHFYVTFPRPDEEYKFSWSAEAGNMLREKTGELIVRLSSRETTSTKQFPILLSTILKSMT